MRMCGNLVRPDRIFDGNISTCSWARQGTVGIRTSWLGFFEKFRLWLQVARAMAMARQRLAFGVVVPRSKNKKNTSAKLCQLPFIASLKSLFAPQLGHLINKFLNMTFFWIYRCIPI